MNSKDPKTTGFAGIEPTRIDLVRRAARRANALEASFEAALDVVAISKAKPTLLVCDVDRFRADGTEFIRQLRFVLPSTIIAVYTASTVLGLAVNLHSAGANCVLSKTSNEEQLARGLRMALSTGCYTDPRSSVA